MLAYEALPLLTAKWAKKSFASSMSAIEILRQLEHASAAFEGSQHAQQKQNSWN